MVFFPITSNGEGAELVTLGLEYQASDLKVLGAELFRGVITRNLSVKLKVKFDFGRGVEQEVFGPFEAKNTSTGRLVNLSARGIFMREVPVPPDVSPPEPGDPVPGTIQILAPSELVSFSVEWI